MSVYRENIEAFIQVYQSGLIPEPDQQDLRKLVVNLPENNAKICDEIENWLKVETRGRVLTAYEEKLKAIIAAEKENNEIVLGPGKIRPNTSPNEPDETLKEQLTNAIQPASTTSNQSSEEDE
ncbi:MAG: hypothetical protein SXA11_08290 [Cyanobacteriota bacterium]|nr:hypothetical protein [Cyanobacteriota bacterium]